MAGPWTGDVSFTVLDGSAGVVSVPSTKVQCVIGTSTSGTALQVVPTQSLATLTSTFTNGPLVEAAGLVVQAGGVVLAVKTAAGTAGAITVPAALTSVSGTGNTVTPIVITVSSTATVATGQVVTIAGVTGNTAANGTFPITVLSGTTFSIPATGNGTYGGSPSITPTGTVAVMAGTDSPVFSGTPNDSVYAMVVAQTGFTAGTAGGAVLVSLDAGRTYGPPIAVGTSLTLALQDSSTSNPSGLTLTFQTGKTWVGGGVVNGKPVGDYARCSTTEPLPSAAGVAAALQAIVTYLAGSTTVFPIIQITGTYTNTDAATIEAQLDTMAGQYLFERLVMPSRDAKAPLAWSGAGETEATWLSSINTAFSAQVSKRVCATGGYYNMPSAFPTSYASSPIYRRPFSFALCARQVAIAAQRHAGKVGGAEGGNLTQIVRSPAVDPYDGFIYHDEYLTPSLDYFLPGGVGRFASARTHARKQGFFASNPLLLAQSGSDFALLPRGIVMDFACITAHGVLSNFAMADLVTNTNGTLSDSAAKTIWGACYDAIQSNMKAVGMISDFTVAVDQTQNIQITNTLVVTITILGVAYVLQVNVTTGFANTLSATAIATS